MKKQTATQAYKKNTATIQATIRKLQAGLKRHAEEQAKDPKNWGYAGDASYVVDLLMQAAEFINDEED